MSTLEQNGDGEAGLLNSQTYRVMVRRRNVGALSSGYVIIAQQMGISHLDQCLESQLYFLEGSVSSSEVQHIASELLADPVTEQFDISLAHSDSITKTLEHVVEVTLLPGVTDPAAENLLHAVALLGINGLERTATGQHYALSGELSNADIVQLATVVLSNPVIQRYTVNRPIEPPFFAYHSTDKTVDRVDVRLANDAMLMHLSANRRLALDLAEMQAIRSYYKSEQRDPSDVELEMIAQTWSEHCVHKTFKAIIDCAPSNGTTPTPQTQEIDGLLRTYIRAATERVNKPWVRSAFVDNAGIVAFDDDWDLAFKVETHNHPSALEPFGGANTGVGGVIRDIIGVSARPIANTDVLCFGPQDLLLDELPAGVLHPRRVADGVVRGVEDYGNKMGIPTVNGAILYHPGYTANPLVFCGCLGLLPHGSHPSTPQTGDLVIVIGGRTGRDGLRGATFSSMEMDQSTSGIAGTAVQIGHPIHEKQAMEAVLLARDARLYSALTDCGAGGLSSAVGELGKDLGVRVQLENVPLKYPGLRPWEIWLSEAQERMVLAVPPDNWPKVKAICDSLSIEAVSIGMFEDTGRIHLYYENSLVADLDMDFLHNGIPRRSLKAWIGGKHIIRESPPVLSETLTQKIDIAETLLALLAHPDIRSKESVIRLYDHEVQGGAAIKPLTGALNHGPSDAAVIVPQAYLSSRSGFKSYSPIKGVALSNGICPNYTELDPYAMAWAAIDEAMRNAVAVGADPDRVSLLDNFCWGNPNLPDRLGSLVNCARGCYDAAVAFEAPFISGKDSLNNEYMAADGHKHAIPGTLLISALGIVPDVNRTVSMDLKQAENRIYMIGTTLAELGGSHFSLVARGIGDDTPTPQPVHDALIHMRRLHQAIVHGLVQACHDCSEGGLGVALAEMCLAGQLGAAVNIGSLPEPTGISDEVAMFSESLCRFIVEVKPSECVDFEALLADTPFAQIGVVTGIAELRVSGLSEGQTLQIPISQLDAAWRGHEVIGLASEQMATGVLVKSVDRGQPHPATLIGRRPRVLILHATGTNRDHEAEMACELAGGDPEIVHINQLIAGERNLLEYAMLVVPGGFSYGDDLGAGTLWALDLRHKLTEVVTRFVADQRPVLGICNGFQALVKANLLPGNMDDSHGLASDGRTMTLAPNRSGHFECRWVYLKPEPDCRCVFTTGLSDLIYCPVAHGEGRIAVCDESDLSALKSHGLIALTYVNAKGGSANYPDNPNGSAFNIAGLTNQAGNVLGLMPHPENHLFGWQHPRNKRGESGLRGLCLFENGIRYAKSN